MNAIQEFTYMEYEFVNGEFSNKVDNFRIVSLARRHKYYLNCIKSITGNKNSWGNKKCFRIIMCKRYANTRREKIAGFLIYSWNTQLSGEEAYSMALEFWLVDKKFRGTGIGGKLYNEFLEVGTSYGLSNIRVMFKEDDATLASLYSHLGFKLIKEYGGRKIEQSGNHIKWYKIVHHHINIPHNDYAYDENKVPIKNADGSFKMLYSTKVKTLYDAEINEPPKCLYHNTCNGYSVEKIRTSLCYGCETCCPHKYYWNLCEACFNDESGEN